MLYSKPPDKLVKISFRFVVVNLFDCCHHGTDDETRASDQWRTRFVDRIMLRKDFPPSEDACARYTEALEYHILVPAKLPKSQHTFLEIRADSTVDHDDVKTVRDWKYCDFLFRISST